MADLFTFYAKMEFSRSLLNAGLASVQKPIEVGFLVVDGFSMMCFANAVEPLRAANMILGKKLFRRTVITLDGESANSSSNLSLNADNKGDEAQQLDWLFVIASYNYQDFANPQISSLIRRLSRNAKVVGGLDCGSWLMAHAGLLENYTATIHWQELALFTEQFPQLTPSDQRYVVDRQRVSAGGAVAALDLMLELVRGIGGENLFFDMRNLFLYDVSQPAERSQQRHGLAKEAAPKLYSAIELMEGSAENPLPLEDIAKHASMSLRSLNRSFQKHIGISPGQYYLQLRLKAARRLIAETKLSITAVASRCGFNSPQAFSRAFRAKFATSPNSLRRGRERSLLQF
ncbi:MAG: transcriptional regulator GlxA family with amidase domain [Saprospiraceae bacterium]|jgi:transcriptional regulator GlxA family with amidase domain